MHATHATVRFNRVVLFALIGGLGQAACDRSGDRLKDGGPYDVYFEWSDDRIYCSELAWKMYKQALGIDVGNMQKLGDFDLSDPAVAGKLKERFGGKPPLDEPVISPAAMFDSNLLETVVKE